MFRWITSPAAQTFHLQVDDSCDLATECPFSSPEIDESGLATTSFVPAVALPAPRTAPYRQRYHWRVRACHGEICGPWSAARYFVVGQDLALNRDLNGDGYADFLVGARYSSAKVEMAGQAFVYLGGPTLPSRPALVINSDIPTDCLGGAVALAGDVNGDGFGDFLVRTNGRVLVFYGGPVLKDQPDITFTAVGADLDNVVGCGDLNGDGYDDIAYGALDVAPQPDVYQPARVEIHFGGPAMATSQSLVLLGEDHPDFFGSSLAAAGDVNGDGYPDLVVGAQQAALGSGRARIYFGGPQMDATPDVILDRPTDPSAPIYFGSVVAGVGDVNGDGFPDVAVGAPDGDRYPAPPGAVYVYYGGPSPHTTPDVVLPGFNRGDLFGRAVVSAGDLNHDGYADIAVIAQGIFSADEPFPSTLRVSTPGTTFLYLGGPSPSLPLFASAAAGSSFPTNFGLAAFDLDGDAEPEILTTQLSDYGTGSATEVSGQVAIYQGRNGYASPARTISAPSSAAWFGSALSR
jgi:hypothetical protein